MLASEILNHQYGNRSTLNDNISLGVFRMIITGVKLDLLGSPAVGALICSLTHYVYDPSCQSSLLSSHFVLCSLSG